MITLEKKEEPKKKPKTKDNPSKNRYIPLCDQEMLKNDKYEESIYKTRK